MKRYIYSGLIILIIIFGFNGCGTPAIIQASMDGNLPKVKLEVKNGVDINTKNQNGFTILHSASMHGHLKIVKYLIKHGARVDDKTIFGDTALVYAVIKGDIDIVKYLIEHDANINIKNLRGVTILAHASRHGQLNIIKYLVLNGINIVDDEIALHRAAGKGHLHIVKYLIENGTNINKVDGAGRTALYYAKVKKRIKIVNYIENKLKSIDQKQVFIKQVQKKNKQQKEVNSYIKINDLKGLKNYTDQNPNAVYYIKDEGIRLALTGPKGMKVGDIRKYLKDGQDEIIVVSLIKRVKNPYKEFTIHEIKRLQSMGLSSKIISTMMDVTTKLLENEEKRKQQKFFLAEQQRIKEQKVNAKIVYKNSKQKVDAQGNPIAEKIKDEAIKQGVGMLLDHFF